MSNAVSALQGKAFSGYVTITEQGLQGMITLRGDFGSTKLRTAVAEIVSVRFPDRNECLAAGQRSVAWMSPDELLLMCPHDEADQEVSKIADALSGEHFLAANVSDARAVLQVTGALAREVIAKLSPVDMSPEAFPIGHFRRTRLAQVPAALWMRDGNTIELICFRSAADYVFDLLKRASQDGSEVGYF